VCFKEGNVVKVPPMLCTVVAESNAIMDVRADAYVIKCGVVNV
jgi:hypothetical protein